MTNREIIADVYGRFLAGDLQGWADLMDPAMVWKEAEGFPLYTGVLVGPKQVMETVIERVGAIGNEFTVDPQRFIADGDVVVVLGTYSWKHKVSGQPVVVQMAHVWTLDGGRVVAFEQHVDTARVRDEMV